MAVSTDIRSRKLAARDAQQIAKRHRRALKQHYRRCFWTWPLGHVYADGEIPGGVNHGRACVACGKPF